MSGCPARTRPPIGHDRPTRNARSGIDRHATGESRMEAVLRRVKQFLRNRPALRFVVRLVKRLLGRTPPAPVPIPVPAGLSPEQAEAFRREAERQEQYRAQCRREADAFAYRPLVSVVVP